MSTMAEALARVERANRHRLAHLSLPVVAARQGADRTGRPSGKVGWGPPRMALHPQWTSPSPARAGLHLHAPDSPRALRMARIRGMPLPPTARG